MSYIHDTNCITTCFIGNIGEKNLANCGDSPNSPKFCPRQSFVLYGIWFLRNVETPSKTPSRKRKREHFLFDEIEEDIHCCFKSFLITSTSTMSSPESRNSSNDLRSFSYNFRFSFCSCSWLLRRLSAFHMLFY